MQALPMSWTLEQIAEGQWNDPDIRPILEKLSLSQYKPSWDDIALYSTATKSLWHQWERLVIWDDVLYRRFYSTTGDVTNLQLVIPYDFRSGFFKLAHEGITGGHLGRSRTGKAESALNRLDGGCQAVSSML